MKRKISILVLIMGCICLVSGAGLLLTNQKNDKEQLEEIKASIVSDYENFKVKIESFSEERETIYENLNAITYLTDLPSYYDSIVSEYDKYANILKEIEEASENLKINCYMYEFTETEISNKVVAFTINYEQAVNYYIQDVNEFNEKVLRYNDWVESSELTETYSLLKEYEISYTNYVDINGDGIYNGIENS